VFVSIWQGKKKSILDSNDVLTFIIIFSCVNLLAPPDDLDFLKTARAIYRQQEKYAQALNLSIRVGDMELIKEDFEQCPDP
jgi:26S proteasome regulatory subunit N1